MRRMAGGSDAVTGWQRLVGAVLLSFALGSTQGLAQPLGVYLPVIKGPIVERPIEAVGLSPTAAQEGGLLQTAVQAANQSNMADVEQALEAFVTENPSSVWTPSLQANLGRHYCTEGHWTKSLEEWEQAWDATKNYERGAGKRVADYTLAHWTRLLVELGRLDELQVLLAEAGNRRLDGGPLTQKFLRTKELYGILQHYPEASYRCGWLVLNRLSIATRNQALDATNLRSLYQENNLLQTCSMSALAQMAMNGRWSMAGVARPDGSQDLPIPSVMHFSQGHYIALLQAQGPVVLAYDPIFGVRNFRRDVLNAEASGKFLVTLGQVPTGWSQLSTDEMASTVGRSGGVYYQDPKETICPTSPFAPSPPSPASPPPAPAPPGSPAPAGGPSGSGGSGDGDGGSGSSCASCGSHATGMVQWRVSEPNINLWLWDNPISCQSAYGPAVGFDVEFKQRDEESSSDTFSFGVSWNSRWLSHVYCYTSYGFSYGGAATVSLPGGGAITFNFPAGQNVADMNYEYNCRLTATVITNNQAVAFVLDFPDGRQYVYDRAWDSWNFYMSSSVDSQGFVTRYNYSEVDHGPFGTYLELSTVADQANNTLFSLSYTNGTYAQSLVSEVTDRFGRSANLDHTEDPVLRHWVSHPDRRRSRAL